MSDAQINEIAASLGKWFNDRDYKDIQPGRANRLRDDGTLDPDMTADCPPGYIWVRRGVNGERGQSRVLNAGVNIALPDRPIKIGTRTSDGEVCAYGIDANSETAAVYGDSLVVGGAPYVPPSSDSTPKDARWLTVGRISPATDYPSTLYVKIDAFWHNGRFLGGINHDAGSGNLPGSSGQFRWALICVDDDNTSYTLTGTSISAASKSMLQVASAADIDVPAGYIPCGLVSLAYGQTAVSESRFEDPRNWIAPRGTLLSEDAETLTIASGEITAGSGSFFVLAAQSGTADDLDTITASGTPRMIVVQADSGDTITVKHGTDNISLNGAADVALSGDKTLALFFDGTNWSDVSVGGGGSGGGSTEAAAYASLTTGSAGDLRFPTDGFHIYRSNGSALIPWGPLFPMTLPSFSGAWTNQGSATITTEKGSIVLTSPGNTSGAALRVYTKAIPSVPYTVTVAFIPLFLTVAAASGSIGCGILFRQSSDGKLATLEMESVNSATDSSIYNFLASRKWTNATTFSATYVNSVVAGLFLGGVVWFRITDDNTNRICSISNDGQTWKTLHSVGRTDFLTADEIGFFLRADGATANDSTIRIISYAES